MSDTMADVREYARGTARRPLLALGVLLVLAVPFLAPSQADLATEALIFGLFAISVDVALGYAGLLTLAPAAFFGVGSYTVAKFVVDYDLSFWLGFPAAVILAVLLAVAVGYIPIKRRIGHVYFVLFTLAFGAIMHDFTFVTTWLTGGSDGLGFFSPPSVFGIDLGGQMEYYYFSLALVALVGFGIYRLIKSDYGDVLHATRQNQLRMRYLGYDTDRELMIAWVLSAAVSAFAGAIYVGSVGIASPSDISFALTGDVIIWIIVGGTGTLLGPFAAAVGLLFTQELLQNLWQGGYRLLLGLLFVVFVFTLPDGLMGFVRDDE
ncbi:branched-chain amino acid ABC transporter permease [Halobellus rufus]|uniref:branched-chain amino acid ABC transporter permease n=1 Tax=Halobellus rufus TaxID=1448860 RepID=UPI0006790ADA|nr:branched-chain amino acid ABC transporter permease [Halobellus rufus]